MAQALIQDAGSKLEQADLTEFTREMLDRLVARVDVRKSQLAIHLKSVDAHMREALDADLDKDDFGSPPAKQKMLLVPWKKASIAREIIRPAGDPDQRKKPIKAGTRVELIR